MPEWISVEDRLPSINEPVWIYWKDSEVLIGMRTHKDYEPSEGWYSFEGGAKVRWTNWWLPIDGKNKPDPPDA